MQQDHEVIYLEPLADNSCYDEMGRTWCEDDAWDYSDYDDAQPTKYIRADIAEGRIKALEEMLQKKLDLIRCGIGGNYSGDPYENELYLEAVRVLKNEAVEQPNKENAK